jgi:hypothetical protein
MVIKQQDVNAPYVFFGENDLQIGGFSTPIEVYWGVTCDKSLENS